MKFLDLAFSLLKAKKNIIVISSIILSVVLISTALFVWMQTNFVATLNDYYFTVIYPTTSTEEQTPEQNKETEFPETEPIDITEQI